MQGLCPCTPVKGYALNNPGLQLVFVSGKRSTLTTARRCNLVVVSFEWQTFRLSNQKGIIYIMFDSINSFIPEDTPLPDEIKAIEEANLAPNDYIEDGEIDWDNLSKYK
jgi:hypothetical protein